MEDGGNNRTDFRSKMRHLLSINKQMIPVKFLFFLRGCVLGSIKPYLNVFFASVSLSPHQAGIITGTRFITSSVAGPLWGALIDLTGRRKSITAVLCLGAALPIFSMPWTASLYIPKNTTLQCLPNISDNLSLSISNVNCSHDNEQRMKLFYLLMGLTTVGAIFLGPLHAHIESVGMIFIKTGSTKASSGGQLVFNSIGITLTSYLCGFAADNYHVEGMSRYSPVFFVFLPMVLLLIPTICFVIERIDWSALRPSGETTESGSKIMRSQLLALFRRVDFVFYLITVFISGLAWSTFMDFALLFASDEIKASKARESLIFVAAIISNMLTFPLSSKFIRLLGGTEATLTLSMFVYFIRFIAMSYAQKLWMLIALQALNGFCVATAWTAFLEYIQSNVPDQIKATMYQVNAAIFFGVSAFVANICGGFVYKYYGGRLLYRGQAIICGTWGTCMVLYYAVLACRRRRSVTFVAMVDNRKRESIDLRL